MGKEIKGTSPILHGKENVNGKQVLTEDQKKILKKNFKREVKLKQRPFKKGGKV